MSKTELYLSGIIKYGLYAILLTPLAFWPRALYAFLTPKFILFQVLVEIVFGAWLILVLIKKSDFKNSPKSDFGTEAELSFPKPQNPTDVRHRNPQMSDIKKYRILWFRKLDFKNWLVVALVLFFSISFISAFFGVDFQRSFWGIGARMTGLFAELHFLAWFLVLVSVSKSGVDFRSPTSRDLDVGLLKPVDIVKYLNFSFVVSILVALSAFYQNTQWHLVPGYTIFSNPTFVAPYFLFHFFWGLYQFFSLREITRRVTIFKLKKWFFGAGTALIAIALIIGQVRGAIIGLLAGLFVVGAFLVFGDILAKKHYRILAAVLMLVIILSVAAMFLFKDSEFVKNSTYLRRFSDISLSATTAQTRIFIWQTAIKGFSAAPIFGVGPENFNYLFNANYNPRLLIYGGSSFAETWQDKPHNAFIEILAEIGIIGGLTYISVWLFIVFYLFRIFERGEKFLSLILASAFIAYFGAIFFSFDSFGSWFGLFLFLAFLASHDSNTNNTNEHTNNTDGNFLKNIFMSFICAGLFVLLSVNYSIWNANIADADALRVFSQDTKSGLVLFEKSLSYKSPYKSEYQFDLIASVAGAVEKGVAINDLENVINFTLNETEKAVLAHPKNASSYTDMTRIYNIFGTLGRDPEILAQAEQFGKKSLELSPNRQETLFYLARTALLQNKPAIAVEWAKQAVAADSTIGTSHWYLGLAYIADNQVKEGTLEIKKALDLGYYPKNDAEKNFIKNLGL